MLLVRYECPRCDCTWSDACVCQADDDCPACGLRITPAESLEYDDEVDQEEAA